MQTADGYNGGRKSVTKKNRCKILSYRREFGKNFVSCDKKTLSFQICFFVLRRRFHPTYELQLHRFSFSSGQFAVIQSANNTAPITAISLDDILPSDEKARNITSKNKYQLSSNIICSYDFLSQYAMRKNKVTKFSLQSGSYN